MRDGGHACVAAVQGESRVPATHQGTREGGGFMPRGSRVSTLGTNERVAGPEPAPRSQCMVCPFAAARTGSIYG